MNICGGLAALHKCTLIAWSNQYSIITLLTDPLQPLHMSNGKGSKARVEFLPSNCPNMGLGYHICPHGSQTSQISVLYYALLLLCNSVSAAYLTEPETCLLLCQQIVPKLKYTLPTTSFSWSMCSWLDTLLTPAFGCAQTLIEPTLSRCSFIWPGMLQRYGVPVNI